MQYLILYSSISALTQLTGSVHAQPGLTSVPAVELISGTPASISVQTLPDRPGSDTAIGHDIVVIAPDEIWGVGEWRITPASPSENELGSQLFRYDGVAWSRFDPPNQASTCNGLIWSIARSIDAGPDGIYAVGEYKDDACIFTDTLLFEGDAGGFSQTITPGQSAFGAQGFLFEDVHVDSDGVVWMGGQFSIEVGGPVATIIRMDNSGFERFDGPLILSAAHRVRSIDSASPSDIWAAGSAGGPGSSVGRSYALHFDGSQWSEVSPPQHGFGEILWEAEVVGPDDVWMSGQFRRVVDDGSTETLPLMWHWDGSGWTRYDSPGFAAELVVMGPDDIYGASNNTLIHWDGSSWSIAAVVPDGLALNLAMRSLTRVSPSELIALGDAGAELTTGRSTVAVRFLLTQTCPADLTGDQSLDFFDVSAFLSAFNAMDPIADITGDGSFDFFDVSAFLNAFNAGCP
ncbi:MAG: hypothetical protein KDA29_12890 [Phycisphaerales bacterium]|nr:hypothetical protein [Phycisphaerales bacterium]